MFSNMFSTILNSDILPKINGTFWGGLSEIGSIALRWLWQALANVLIFLLKLALGLIDFMQFLVQKLAGLDVWMNLDRLDLGNLKETDVVFRFLFSDAVVEVFRTMFSVFLVLLIVFTIFAIIKNEYSSAYNGGEVKDHKKSWIAAGKAILTVITVPIFLIMGIIGSNAILASLAKAFNVNGNLSLGGQIFVASAYDASSYRYYAKEGIRKYTSNQVTFEYDSKYYTVNSAVEAKNPNKYNANNPFTGYMFTYNNKDYFLFECEENSETKSGDGSASDKAIIGGKDAYYNYITHCLGATIVKSGHAKYEDLYGEADRLSTTGFMKTSLRVQKADSLLIEAAYNTWEYNSVLVTNYSNWGSQNLTLDISTSTFKTINDKMRDAFVVNNSANWAKLHDGGVNGFSPLAVEYLAMADVIDFVMENGVTLYYVNAHNANINYQGGSMDTNTLVGSTDANGSISSVSNILVDYKDMGRVAYDVANTQSELNGATYIVCYLDSTTNQYIPLVNGKQMEDAKGNRYTFNSSQFSENYHGPVIARGMFKKSNQARNCEPTYITSTLIVDSDASADFDSKLATAVKLDYINSSPVYTYLNQLTNVTQSNIELGQSYASANHYLANNQLIYYADPKLTEGTASSESWADFVCDFEKVSADEEKRDKIVENIVNIIVPTLSDENGNKYSYVNNTAGIIANSDSRGIFFYVAADSASSPKQYHKVSLKIKQQSVDGQQEDIAPVLVGENKYLYKIIFGIAITLEGATPTLNTTNVVTEYTNVEGTFSKQYKVTSTGDGSYTVTYTLPKVISGRSVNDACYKLNTTNTNYIVEEIVNLLKGCSLADGTDIADKVSAAIGDNNWDISEAITLELSISGADSGSITFVLNSEVDNENNTGRVYTIQVTAQKTYTTETKDDEGNVTETERKTENVNVLNSSSSAFTGVSENETITIDQVVKSYEVKNEDTTFSDAIVEGKMYLTLQMYGQNEGFFTIYNDSGFIADNDGNYNGEYAIKKILAQTGLTSVSDSINLDTSTGIATLTVTKGKVNTKHYYLKVKFDTSYETQPIDPGDGNDYVDFQPRTCAVHTIEFAVVASDELKNEKPQVGSGQDFMTVTQNLYFRENYQNGTSELYFIGTKDEMSDNTVISTVDNKIAPAVAALVRATGFDISEENSEGSVASGVSVQTEYTTKDGEAFWREGDNKLAITFVLKMDYKQANSSTISYYTEFTLYITDWEGMIVDVYTEDENGAYYKDGETYTTEKPDGYTGKKYALTQETYYKYTFDSTYEVYNTFKAYEDNTDIASENTFSLLDNDLVKSEKAVDYLVSENPADSEQNSYVKVWQYKYKQTTASDTITYKFNAIKTGVECDNGYEFITGSWNAEDSKVDFDDKFKASHVGEWDEQLLAFAMGKLRVIYMPEYSYISYNEANKQYTLYIIDVDNTSATGYTYYTVTFDYNALGLDSAIWNNEESKWESGNYTASNGSDAQARTYIKSHFSFETMYVDLHAYQNLDIENNLYKATLESNTGKIAILTGKNAENGLINNPIDSNGKPPTGVEYPLTNDVILTRLQQRADNLNANLTTASIGLNGQNSYKMATATTSFANDLAKFAQNPVSVVFCRDQMSEIHLVGDFQLHIWSATEGFDFVFRAPKIGFATIQKNDDGVNKVALSLVGGAVSLDYNFEGVVEMGNVYLATEINVIIMIFAVVLIFSILGKAVWGLISRIYQITLLFLIMPAVASTLPIDEKGSRFENWKNKLISQVLGAYGVTIGLNFFFILLPVIRDASAIFTDADIAGMTSTMKLFAGSADRLNYLCYVLFMLVAFTLIKTVPSLVQEFTGFKDADVIKQGEETKKGVVSTVEEVGKNVSGVVTGKKMFDAWDKTKGFAKSMIPGKAIYDKYKEIKKKKQDKKDQEAKENEQKNQQYAMEHAKQAAQEAKDRMANAQKTQATATGAQNTAATQHATPTGVAAMADGLTDKAKAEIIAEATEQSKEFAGAAMQVAEAAMEAADAQFGNVHDYVGDKEKAEEEAKIQAEAKYEEAVKRDNEGKSKGSLILTKKDIERWNAGHGADEQIKKIERSMFATEEEFRDARKHQFDLRKQARDNKYLTKRYNILQDERAGIKHGVGAAVKRAVIGGEKTWDRVRKETEKRNAAEANLQAEKKNKSKIAKINNQIDTNNVNNYTDVLNALGTLGQTAEGKKARKVYDDYVAGERLLGRNGIDVHREAIEKAKEVALGYADKKVQKAEKTFAKAEDTLAEKKKGAVYTLGKYGKRYVAKPIANTAEVVGKWAANKGHTFLYGHTDQDKETAKYLLKQHSAKKGQVTKAKNKLDKARNEIPKEYERFMNDYNKMINQKQNQQQINMFLQKNKHLLQGSGFGLLNNGKDAARFAAYIKQEGISSNKNLDKLYKHRQAEIDAKAQPYLDKYNDAQKNLATFEKNNKNSLKRAKQTLNNKHIRSIGVVGEAKRLGRWTTNTVLPAAWKETKLVAKKGYNFKWNQGVRNWNKKVATNVGQFARDAYYNPIVQQELMAAKRLVKNTAKFIYTASGAKMAVKAYRWNEDRRAGKARGRKTTQENIVAIEEKIREERTKREQLVGQALVKKQKDTEKAIIKTLEERMKFIEADPRFHSGLKVAEMKRLLEKAKKDILTEDEKKQIAKYLNMMPALTDKQNKTDTYAQKYTDDVKARKEREKDIAALEKKMKNLSIRQLNSGLLGINLTQSEIDKIVKKVNKGTATEINKQARKAVEKIVNDKTKERQKAVAQNNTVAQTKLEAEIRKLHSTINKLQNAESTYKVQMKKVQADTQKAQKQLKVKKSADALRQSINNQTNNPFTKN